jgi:hypothetical protein
MLAVLFLVAATGAPAPSAPTPLPLDCRLANRDVEAAIARKVAALHGVEYCQFRHYETQSDLDGDGEDDLVMLFNVEPASGENDHDGYMAVFLSSDPPGSEPLFVRTGGRGERDATRIAVRGKQITLDTDEYLPQDPMCCPSGHGTLLYELAGRSLKRVKQKSRVKRDSP